jgi:tyrosine-protein kinase Etk/Wzc
LNLATALTERRAKRVLLIDADLHSRSVEQQLGLSPDIGFAECVQDGLDPQVALRRIEPLGWYFLSGGKRDSSNPAELFRPLEVSALFQRLALHFDWILVDSPPVLALTDALCLSQSVDGTLLVARAGRTPKKAVEDTINLVGRNRLLGLVLNGLDNTDESYKRYSHYYRDRYAEDDETH